MPCRGGIRKTKEEESFDSFIVGRVNEKWDFGHDDLFASMQSKDQGPSEEAAASKADVNNHAVSEVAKTKDATSRSETLSKRKSLYSKRSVHHKEIRREKWVYGNRCREA